MKITVFAGANSGTLPEFSEMAKALGEWIGREGHQLIYGGGHHGLMGAVASGVRASGGEVTAIIPQIFASAMDAETEEGDHVVHVGTIDDRIQMMCDEGDLFIALPGGAGTLEEISAVLSRIHSRNMTAFLYLFNIDNYYQAFNQFLERMVLNGFLSREEKDHLIFCKTLDQLTGEISSSPH